MNKPPPFTLAVQFASQEKELPTRSLLRRWCKATLRHPAQLTIRIVDEEEGRELNKNFRGKDYPTNVLTFTYDDELPLMGDVVLCAPVVAREAHEQSKELCAHYAHLVVHALLHLQGYEHEEDGEATHMEAQETAILAKLGYADPY